MSKVNSAISGAATGASIGGPVGAAVGGGLGFVLGKDDNSNDYYQKMLEEALKIPLPVLREMNPELYQVVTQLNPEMEQNVVLGPSATEGISLDPKYKQAQMQALNKLMNISESGGQDAQFISDMNRTQNEINSNLKGNTGAIQQNMATRGMSGGMSEMVAKQIAAQEASNRQADMGMDIQAQAQQRALQALMNQGNMAGQISQQDFSQQNTVAQSQDAISKFNAQNQQNVMSNNTAARNNAQQFNVQAQQNTADKNVATKNQAQQYNLGLAQQQYDNELKKRGLVNQGYTAAAQNSYQQAKDQDEFIGGLFSAGAKYAGSKKIGE